MTKSKSEETPRSYSGRPVLRKDPSDGTPMLAPMGFPLLMSTTYASSPASLSASTQELTRQSSECTVEENVGRRAPEADAVAEEALNEEDLEDWIASNVLDTVVKLKSDKPLQYHKKFIVASEDQKWKLMPTGEWPGCCNHKHSGFFFYRALLDVMGVRIPFTEFHKEVLDWLMVAPSQLQPNAWEDSYCKCHFLPFQRAALAREEI